MNKVRHNFTLLEILVAVSVLVIMMGFLFQFVISAQRVWAASTARTYMADQANAVFGLMAEDLSQIAVVSPDDDLDSQMGWHCYPDPQVANLADLDSLTQFCFFTTDRDEENGAIYGVMYYYEKNTTSANFGKLYRRRTASPAWDMVGKTDSPSLAADFGLPAETESDDDYLVAENITEFKVQAAGDTDSTVLPKFIRVTMKVKVPPELANTATDNQIMDRTFSRIFFFDQDE